MSELRQWFVDALAQGLVTVDAIAREAEVESRGLTAWARGQLEVDEATRSLISRALSHQEIKDNLVDHALSRRSIKARRARMRARAKYPKQERLF